MRYGSRDRTYRSAASDTVEINLCAFQLHKTGPDCEELRYCPNNTISRAAYEHVHRSRWSRYMRATIELLGPSHMSVRGCELRPSTWTEPGGTSIS